MRTMPCDFLISMSHESWHNKPWPRPWHDWVTTTSPLHDTSDVFNTSSPLLWQAHCGQYHYNTTICWSRVRGLSVSLVPVPRHVSSNGLMAFIPHIDAILLTSCLDFVSFFCSSFSWDFYSVMDLLPVGIVILCIHYLEQLYIGTRYHEIYIIFLFLLPRPHLTM